MDDVSPRRILPRREARARASARRMVLPLALAALAGGAACAHAEEGGDAAAPSAAATDASAASSLDWTFEWRGWDGLRIELVQDTPLDVSMRHFRLDQVRLAGTLGARLEFDAALFDAGGTLTGFDDGVELRRARIKLAGDAILGVPFRYKVEFGYVPGSFSLSDFYVAVPDIRVLGTLQVGQFAPSMGLQLLTSSWDIELMEPAATLQALGPKTSPGFRVGQPFLDGRGTWSIGAYGGGPGTGEYGSTTEDMTSAIARLTWLAVDRIDADASMRNRFLHIGLSGSRQQSSGGEVRYRSRPESYIAPYVIDTGTILTDRAYTLGAELLWVDGPLTAQAEVLRSTVLPSGGQQLNFVGGYLMGAWSLTGESRGYNRDGATLASIRPARNFAFGPEGGWGAIEAALRYSYTDLDDGNVAGGKLSMLMAGLDWTFRPQLQWMINIGLGRVRGGAADGRMVILQSRIGLNF
jgi:phosphate-selective porin OprO and OprP